MGRMVSLAVLLLFFCVAVHAQTCADEGITTTADIMIGGSAVSEIVGNLGNPFVAVCAVTVDPGTLADTPPNIESYIWTRNGVRVLEGLTGNELRIDMIESSDGGQYRCSAVTDWPCTTVESDITTVNTAPTVTLDPRSDFTVTVGDRIELNCQVEGWPTPTIQWTRATGAGTVVEVSTNPTLVIDSASLVDSTDYTCFATNGLSGGTNRDTITVTVVEPTDPPTVATTQPQTASSGDNQMNSGAATRPEQEMGFYIAIAVTAFVCLLVAVLTIISVTIWWVLRRKEEQVQYYGDEEIIMEPIDNQN